MLKLNMAELIHQILSKNYPTSELAGFEIAIMSAQLEMPKGVIHVISDIHGEARKLRHVINNASGRLRPVVEKLFSGQMDDAEMRGFLHLLYYPTEFMHRKTVEMEQEKRYDWVRITLLRQFEVIRELIKTKRRKEIRHFIPKEFRELFEVLLNYPAGGHHPGFLDVQIHKLVDLKLDFLAIRAASRFIRNSTIDELIVAGDLGDRGARIDWVIDYLMQQPSVSVVWGNHDVSWMGACLGLPVLIAIVLRISLRYRRLFQLEEGYGILTKALETLATTVYAEDPAEAFKPKRGGERDELLISRMQKAIAVIQFKLEGEMVERHPEWQMADRNVMTQINGATGTVMIDGKEYPLKDHYFPTLDPKNPNQLSEEEQLCMDRLVESFTSSSKLWQHMSWVAERGAMASVKDKAVIFHACLALDEHGDYEELIIDGEPRLGVEQFAAFDVVVKRAFKAAYEADSEDKDWFYYLWAGPKSPLFGKDKMTSFESYFVADQSTHLEKRNLWFEKLHDAQFCDDLCKSMGVKEGGLIVNGHVPVKVQEGENPIKRGGNAVTIDGAFSEAYGDRGYTLILSAKRDELAEHHGFKDPVSVVRSGEDIIPKMYTVREHDRIRLVKDTEKGESIRQKITALEGLIEAYARGDISEGGL